MIPVHDCFLFTLITMKLHTMTPHESRMCPIDFPSQKVKGQGHNALITENGLFRITAFPLLWSSWNFIQRHPMNPGCAFFLILESKGQRSRSQCYDHWKWFLSHCCFPFTCAIIIIKLHAQIPIESRIFPNDNGVKNLSLNWYLQGGGGYLSH